MPIATSGLWCILGCTTQTSRSDISEHELKIVDGQAFCPYLGRAYYYDICTRKRAAWSYVNAWPVVARINNLVSFEPNKIDVYLDEEQLHLEPGQAVIPHGVDRGLDTDEVLQPRESDDEATSQSGAAATVLRCREGG